jgi:hypothetical protein
MSLTIKWLTCTITKLLTRMMHPHQLQTWQRDGSI